MALIGAHSALEMAPRKFQPPFAIVAAYQTGTESHRTRRLSRLLGLTYVSDMVGHQGVLSWRNRGGPFICGSAYLGSFFILLN